MSVDVLPLPLRGAGLPPWRRAWRKLLHLRMLLLDRRKYERVVLEDVDGLSLVVLPEVFNPKLLRTGEFLVQQLHRLPAGCRVLDLGSGSGAAGVAVRISYASTFFTTLPCTSVKRKSRP